MWKSSSSVNVGIGDEFVELSKLQCGKLYKSAARVSKKGQNPGLHLKNGLFHTCLDNEDMHVTS